MQDRDGTGRTWWFFVGAMAAIAVLAWLTLWGEKPGDDPLEPGQPPGADQVAPAPDDEAIETPTGPLDRPPGTAPADPRRPATVPHEGRRHPDRPSSDGGQHNHLDDAPDAERPESPQRRSQVAESERSDSDSGAEEPTRRTRWRELSDRLEDRDREADAEAFAEEIPDDAWERGEGWYEDGEWVDADQALRAEEDPEDVDHQDPHDEEGELSEAPWSQSPGDDDAESGPSLRDRQTYPTEDSTTVGATTRDEGDSHASSDRSPAAQALAGYQDHLDQSPTPTAADAGTYSAMAMTELAEALYILSAGRTLPVDEAARQRDDIVDAANPESASSDEAQSDEQADDPIGESPSLPPEFEDGQWTVWLEATDWLRDIQEQDYPGLAHLVDEVEEKAALIDPELQGEEQVEALIAFFEAVELVLEAMALDDDEVPWNRAS